MKEIRITEQEENQRLDKFLLKYMNKAPKGFLYKMLRKKRIKLNGGRAEGSELLRAGDMLQLYLAEETMDSFTEGKTLVSAARHFGIVYEDDDILVVSRPCPRIVSLTACTPRNVFPATTMPLVLRSSRLQSAGVKPFCPFGVYCPFSYR